MAYEYGQKIRVKNADFVVTIISVSPVGQPVAINFSDDKVYNVEINGVTHLLKERFLNALIDSEKPEALIVEKIETKEKKKRGRPRKVR